MTSATETDSDLAWIDEPEPAPPSYPPGTLLGGTYCLERQLASGGMGEIYLARHTRLPGWFAIKMLQAALTMDSGILERFRREAELMATLRHPHIAHVVDYNIAPDGRPYLVMEYIDGADLAAVAREHCPMEPALAADFIRQTASALAAAHAKGIVHLDLKPENIMVLTSEDRTPFVKVIDFGIAKSIHHPAAGGPLIGTPEYMSPEQVDGRPELVDGRSDQFSLAVMAFFLLTGHSPWGAEEPMTTLYRICQEPPQVLANYISRPVEQIENVLRRAMAKSPTDRFPSVTAFARAFDEAVAWDTASERRPSAVDFLPADFITEGATMPELPVVAEQVPALVSEGGPSKAALRRQARRRNSMRMTAMALAAGFVAWLTHGVSIPLGLRSHQALRAGVPGIEVAERDDRLVPTTKGEEALAAATLTPPAPDAEPLGVAGEAVHMLKAAFARLASP